MATPAQNRLGTFGRAWNLLINTVDSGTFGISSVVTADESPLRMVFSVEQIMLAAYWRAEISIYNLDNSTVQQIKSDSGNPNIYELWKLNQPIVAGDVVTLSAGYNFGLGGKFDPNSNLIFTGKIFQPMWTRENVTDFKLTLRCVNQLVADALNPVNLTTPKDKTDADTLSSIANEAGVTLDVDQNSQEKLGLTLYPKAQTKFGKPLDLISDIAANNGLNVWLSQDTFGATPNLHVRLFDPNNPPPTPAYAYGPPNLPGSYAPAGTTTGSVKQTMIGTPEQTQYGVCFRVLLDSAIKIGDMIQLAPGALVVPFAFAYAQSYPAVTSQTGQYVVAGVRHVGDTRGRGDDWYTEVTGVTLDFFQQLLVGGTPSGGE